jgi:phosphatidylethanolamine/phosphatidyl-N-methylethanolamine N-methyltransferase
MNRDYIKKVYSFYSPFYNYVFGWILEPRIKYALSHADTKRKKILEIGIGTGLSLKYYDDCEIIGIDLSYEMLKKAQKFNRKCKKNLELFQMDACNLGFKDSSFDLVLCAFVLSTIPNFEDALKEIWRIIKPDGRVIVVNHFMSKNPVIRYIEKGLDPITKFVGWKNDFSEEKILSSNLFELIECKKKRWWSPWKALYLKPNK